MTILFDLDGTLIDSTEAILESFHNSFKIHNFKYPKDKEIKALVGHPLDVMYKELGVPEHDIDNFVLTYKTHYRVVSKEKTVLLNNAKEAVELASTFARLAIVTTKTGLYSRELMEHFELMKYFEVLIGREDVTNPKPHEEPILTAINQMKCDKDGCWMIGDTRLDLISAKNAQIKSIGVTSGYDPESELLKHSEHIYVDALEAVKFLKKGAITKH